MAVRQPEIWRFIGGDHGLLGYCIFGVQAVSDAQNVMFGEKNMTRRIYQNGSVITIIINPPIYNVP